MNKGNRLKELVIVDSLNQSQAAALTLLQKLCFPEVSDQEAEEDFFHPKSAHLLVFREKELVGWAGIHVSDIEFEGKKIKLGGYGICTHPNWQRQGIANSVSSVAMKHLTHRGCDLAFLSVELNSLSSIALHRKQGFILLPRPFSWENAHGETKSDMGGMIAKLNSQEIFDQVLRGKSSLFVGRGYW